MNEYIIGLPHQEKNSVFSVSICGFTFADPSYHIIRKTSDVFDIEYVTKGEGVIISNGTQYNVKEGDVYLLKENTEHEYFSDTNNPFEKIWLNAKGKLINNLLSAYSLSDLTVINNVNISPYLEKIIHINAKNNLPIDEKNSQTSFILHEIFDFINKSLYNKQNITPEALKLKRYIEDNFTHNITLDELASLIYRSKSQTIRIFKSEFNITPIEYLLRCRINHAKLLLKNSSLLIREIAFVSGFDEEHYFSDLFKRRVGISPRDYRNI